MSGPEDRLRRNNAYYDRFAANVTKRTRERDYTRTFAGFTARLRPGATVLDIGCGSGEHMLYFRSLGYDVIGIDPSARMRGLASAKGLPVFDGTFENLSELKLPHVDGVWCAASLLHVPENDLGNALSAIRSRLSIGDPFFATVRVGTGASWDRWDAEDGDVARFIQLYTQERFEEETVRASFVITDRWIEKSTWGRPSEWLSILAVAN